MLKKPFPRISSSAFLIFLNVLFLWLFFSLSRQGLDTSDMFENYAWGITWTLGNNKHPPLFSWITAFWFQIFPTKDWAYYLLNETNLLIALIFLMLGMRKIFNEDKVFIALGLTIVILPLSIDNGYRYNANLAQLPFLTGYLWALLAAFTEKRISGFCLAGIFAGAAVLSKYSAIVLIATITFAIFLYFRPKLTYLLPRLLLAGLIALTVLSPHIYWGIQHDWPTLHYMHQMYLPVMQGDWPSIIANRLLILFTYVASSLVVLGIALLYPPNPIKTTPFVYPRQIPMGLLIFISSVICIFIASYIEQIRPYPGWFIVCSIFFGWALVDILPDTTNWGILRSRIKLLIIFYIILVALVATYKKLNNENIYLPLAALPEIISKDVTNLYHDAYNKHIDYVAGSFPLTYAIPFYSEDHPYGIYGLDIEQSNWINASQFKLKSKVIVCTNEKHYFPTDPICTQQAIALLGNPDIHKILKYRVYDPALKASKYMEYNVLMYR